MNLRSNLQDKLDKYKDSEIFYDCRAMDSMASVDLTTSYVKIAVGEFNLLVPISDLINVIGSTKRFFYIEPLIDASTKQQISLLTTVSEGVIKHRTNLLSANHCQQGSAMLIYTISVCDGEKCWG